MSGNTALPARKDLPVERTWDLEDIFSSIEEWEKAFASVSKRIPDMQQYQGKLSSSAGTLYEALQLDDSISIDLGRLVVYARMRYDEDTTNSFYQGLNERARQLIVQFKQVTSFMTPEILRMEEAEIQAFLDTHEGLQVYSHMFERLNEKRPHVLSEKEEELMARAGDVTGQSGNTFSMLNNADLRFPVIKDENGEEAELSQGRFIGFLQSSSRQVRQDAFQAMYDTYSQYENTFASTLAGSVKKNLFQSQVRGYSSAREAALSANHIPEIVYDQLVDTVNEHLHLLHRYVDIRKRVLELDELHLYDMYTPLVEDAGFNVDYEEAKELMVDGLQAMGPEYQSIVKEGLDDRWVDVDENQGKRSGAYSSGTYGTKPYILMNWQNNITNLFTLAHEFGHSVHSYYTRANQPFPYADYSIFVAEVASTTNEILLSRHLLDKESDPRKRLYLLNHFLEGFRGTVFRQTMFAEFEQLIHEKAAAGTPLTPDMLKEEYYALNQKYFGNNVTIDEEISWEWARIPHFYMNFYVYQYATGYSAAAALAEQIQDEGEPAVERFKDFLKAGNSDYPINVLKKAGVDMTSSDAVAKGMQAFEKTLDEVEQILQQIEA
ncbi:oligoendopeptidase F [Alkalicoccus chagannorensis]|uniref:oligoendopeptidase F n=1 Tax=Alkalicoccus chagannorensis TaxID=427072 RepID=UPI0004023559|nr:oligoendopeptidase F [Alkalicoccus chagannorensis]